MIDTGICGKKRKERRKMQNKSILQNKIMVVFLAMICCLLWGSAFPCIKIGYQLFQIASADTATQILFAGIRFTCAGVLVILAGSLLSGKWLLPDKKEAVHALLLCFFQTVLQYVLFYVGLAHTSGVKASIIEGMNVFLTILIAGGIFHLEKITLQKMIGCLVGFAGVVLIQLTGSGLGGKITFFGEGFLLLSTVAAALSSVFIKWFSRTDRPVVLSGCQFFIGGLIMTAGGIAGGGSLAMHDGKQAGILFYLACISAIAYTLWGILLKYNPVATVAVYGFLNPVCGVFLSAILLGETGQAFRLQSLAALVLVCAGIVIVNRTKEE